MYQLDLGFLAAALALFCIVIINMTLVPLQLGH
jgi:hypothetical protein